MADYTAAVSMVDKTFLRLFFSTVKGKKKAGADGAFENCLGDSLVRAIAGRHLVQQQTGTDSSMKFTTITTETGKTTIWTEPLVSGETTFSRDLITLLVSLPPILRMVYNLRVIDGYSVKETASLLHIDKKEVDSYLSKARSLLRSTAFLFYKI